MATKTTATLVRLLPADELELLKGYVEGTPEPEEFDAIYRALDVPVTNDVPRRAIAVAQIILHEIQGTLPQWASVGSDGVCLNRAKHRRHKDARLVFNPRLVCTINWADSGPGFSWPESYHVTFMPGLNKFIVTSSRDGDDAWGCSDHAIGVADGSLNPTEAAKDVIVNFWRSQFRGWGQERWAYLFDEGLVDNKVAKAWADEVWDNGSADVDANRRHDPALPVPETDRIAPSSELGAAATIMIRMMRDNPGLTREEAEEFIKASGFLNYDPITMAMKSHPGLTREEAEDMAKSMGF